MKRIFNRMKKKCLKVKASSNVPLSRIVAILVSANAHLTIAHVMLLFYYERLLNLLCFCTL